MDMTTISYKIKREVAQIDKGIEIYKKLTSRNPFGSDSHSKIGIKKEDLKKFPVLMEGGNESKKEKIIYFENNDKFVATIHDLFDEVIRMYLNKELNQAEIDYVNKYHEFWYGGERIDKEECISNITIKHDEENIIFLTDRLLKECQQKSTGYIGVEYDNLETTDGMSLTEDFFHKILREINVLDGNSDEYICDEYNNDAPFRSLHNLRQHMVRLSKFVYKYADDYLPTDLKNSFIKEVEDYMNNR